MTQGIHLDRKREMTVEVPKKVEAGKCVNCKVEKKGGREFMRLWAGPGCVIEYCPECFGLLAIEAWGKC